MARRYSHDERDFEADTTPLNSLEKTVGSSTSGKKKGGGLVELLIILAVAFALVFGFVRPFVVQAFSIPSESMVPTLEVGDRVFANKFVYSFSEPERGDIVVFWSPEGGEDPLIKRVIALPGDNLATYEGRLYLNGELMEEPYVNNGIQDGSPTSGELGAATIPEGHVFMMGDNRANSRDSRFFGPVPIENIEGEAFMIFWPPPRVGFL